MNGFLQYKEYKSFTFLNYVSNWIYDSTPIYDLMHANDYKPAARILKRNFNTPDKFKTLKSKNSKNLKFCKKIAYHTIIIILMLQHLHL